MPFSRPRTRTASTISCDMSSVSQQVRAVDVRVRDRDDAGVGGDRDPVVGRAEELPGERRVAVVLSARPHAGAPADVAAEMVWLGQGAAWARRGDLERVLLAHGGEVVGHALAKLERDTLGMIDEQPDLVAVDDLGEKDLDLGLDGRELLLDVGLDRRAHRWFPPSPLYMKKAGQRPLSALLVNESFGGYL